ncbi:hypothetical protein QYE76_067006 [Lolium multiflorum]|uniref:Retrotransposon gag domain-containing protein n=1 Tax=Lolium multiflorum TaxID=4521 RepID=A0AAD8WAC5_LOLMU|nr:hypothetical protein QYE76_067006 [Lolium multiflorum]
MMPKRKAIGYTKPYPNEYELIPLPPKYRLPDFTKFSGSDGSSSIEHVSRYLAQLGMISASDELRVRYFSQSLTGSAFGWYTSLPPNSIQTWKQLEERFHEQYHSEASEAGIADLAQVRQKRGETVSEYIQRFRTVRNRCYSVHVSEKEAVELAVVGLSSSIKEVASQADYPSLAHMVQKLSAYEQRHPDIYQDKFKRVVTMVDAGEDEGPTGEREVAVAEWTRAAGPVTCKWVKPPGPPRGFDFDVTKTEQIFDLLLAEKHIKIPEGHKFPTVQELNGKPYCKWHNTFTHTTNDCRVWRQQIQVAIENGRLIFNQYAMKVDTHPFPAVNMVEFTHLGGCQPDFSANISMVELGHRSEKDGDEDSCSQSKDTEGAAPCDRLRQDGKRYVTEGEVKNIRYQRPLSDHLLNKYVSRYDQRRRYNDNDEKGRLTRNDGRHRRHNHDEERQERHGREQDDTDRHWHCPFFRHCWDSGMGRLPTIGNCPECNRKKKETANVSVFERLGPLPPQNRRAETPLLEDLEDSEDEGEYEEDRCHRPRWCPDGLSHTQKRRVQRLRGLEEAERMYLHTLRKARPDLAAKVQRTLDEEGLPQRKEWRPKQKRADDDTSAGTNMVFIRPAECSAPRLHSAPDMDNSKRTNVLRGPNLRAVAALIVAFVAAVGAAPGRLVVAPMAADGPSSSSSSPSASSSSLSKSLKLPGQGQNRLAGGSSEELSSYLRPAHRPPPRPAPVAASNVAAGASTAAPVQAVDWDPYEPVQYDAPENPYDTTIVDYEPEVESSDVDSDDESFHTKTRHVLRRLQSGQYDGPFARGIYKCPFCNRRLRDTDFNTLLNHVESIGRYGARVGRTVNVHAYMAKHKALGIHLRNLQASHTRYLEALNVPTALSVCDCSICRAA